MQGHFGDRWNGLFIFGRELRPENALFWLLLALLVWLPVPLGSNRVWAWSLMEAAAFALAAAWAILWALGRVAITPSLARASPALALLALWIAYQAFHLVPLPSAWVEVLSPQAARMHSLAAMGVPSQSMTLSLDPHATDAALLKALAYGAVFFLVLALVGTRSRVRTFSLVLVCAAVLHAVYAVLMHLADRTVPQFGELITHGASASGTYANRNHFAGYLEMMLALGIGLLLAGLSEGRADSWKRWVAHVLEWILSPAMVLRLALCILVIALTTTHSRTGNTAFFASLLVAGTIGIVLSRHATRKTLILLASLVVIDLVIVGSWFGVEKLARRLEETTLTDVRVREEPAAYALDIIKDYPLFGSGPGTFASTFPRYRPETVVDYFDYAHNDYAQIGAETGLIGLGLMGLLVGASLAAALLAQWRRRDPLMRGMAFAAVMGITAMLIHSWTDFNLQIPANASLFMVLLALGWISLGLDGKHGTRKSDSGSGSGIAGRSTVFPKSLTLRAI
ncbi:MAG: O-antigen ligase family protein [Usitatibacter sp.]